MATTVSLFGREPEMQLIERVIDGIEDRGGALVLSGEPGIGKSALLGYAIARTAGRDVRQLTASGVKSEALLAFAGLHQLLQPLLDDIDGLPLPQREAVRAALGMSDTAAPDVFLIGLAALNLVANAASVRPVLVVVEDAHWLDQSSANVLAFVARRLESEPIVMLAAIRDGFESSLGIAGLPELHIERLDDVAAAALLDAGTPDLDGAVRDRLLEEAGGNPLGLVELPRAWRSTQEEHVLARTAPPPLTKRLESTFAARAMTLATDTQTLLLIAAVNDSDALSETLAAASGLVGDELTVRALAPAVSALLVDVDATSLRFRHPLVRSAIYQAVSMTERQAAHAALAAVLAHEPDRRVWHRAASIVAPDDEVASELDATAQRAIRRRGTATAVAALERAARLSEDQSGRGARLLNAAELAYQLGWHDVVVRLLKESQPLELATRDRHRLTWLQEYVEDASGPTRIRPFVAIAEQMLRDGEVDLATSALLTAALKCWWSNADDETRELVVAVAERLPVSDLDAKLLAILAFAAPEQRGALVIERSSLVSPDEDWDPEAKRMYGTGLTTVGAFDLAAPFLAAAVEGMRRQGRLGQLAQALVSQAYTAIYLGNWALAASAAEEAERLAQETGQPRFAGGAQIAAAQLAGLRGDEDRAAALIAEAERVIVPMAVIPLMALVHLARIAVAVGAGRHLDAYEQARRLFDPSDSEYHPFVGSWTLPDLVEAAVHSGHRDEARALVAKLEPLAAKTRSPILLAGLSFARPLLANDTSAEALFELALGSDLSRWPVFRARLLLAYGSWLRHQRRPADSRPPLRDAREAFDALGAHAWGEQARHELRASGETSRRRVPEARDELTPQELQIAQLAATGLTNREIGQLVYLSHRTISSHLYKIFPKLGITSRVQLRDVLESGPPSM